MLQVVNCDFDDFGDDLGQNFESIFSVPTHVKQSIVNNDQEVPELALEDNLEDPDELRFTETPAQLSQNYGFIEPTLSNDIMEIVHQHRPNLKRLSDTFDISQRLAKIPRIETDEIPPIDDSIPAFDHSANVVVNVNNDEEPDELVIPPMTPEKTPEKPRKARQKKRKLVIDKVTKITDDELKQNLERYKETLTDPSPMINFEERQIMLKNSIEVLFSKPSIRLKVCAGKPLQPLYERNLKVLRHKIPQRISRDEENSPPKKRKLRERTQEVAIIDIPEAVAELAPIEDFQVQLPEIEAVTEENRKIEKIQPKKKATKYSQPDSSGFRET